MAELTATQEEYDALKQNVDDLVALQNSYISDRDLSAAVAILERSIETHEGNYDTLDVAVKKISAGLNSLSVRFRRYSSDSEALSESAARVPTTDEKAALAGTEGLPSDTNRYVTDMDPRLVEARDPNAHVASHQLGGSDELTHQMLGGDIGTLSHTAIEGLISDNTGDIATNATAITAIEGRATALETWQSALDLDNLPVGSSFAKVSVDQYSRLLDEDTFNALQVPGINATNKFLAKNDADTLYQAAGTYLGPAWAANIDSDLIPDGNGNRNLGSPTNPFGELYLSENTLYIGGKALGLTDGELALDGVKVVNQDTVNDEVSANVDVVAAKAHSDLAHDWDFIVANTSGLTLSTVDLEALGSHDHFADHYTKLEIDNYATNQTGPFSGYVTPGDITGGGITFPWTSLTSVPTLANPSFKGTVDDYDSLPLAGLTNGDVYFVKQNPNEGQLGGAYVVVLASGGTRPLTYRAIYDPSILTHASLSDNTSDVHPQYFNTTRLDSYLFDSSTIASLQAGMGISNAGSGSIITSAERINIATSVSHAASNSNPHSVTAEQVGALRATTDVIKNTHIDFGLAANQVNTDVITEGTTNLWANSQLFTDAGNAVAHMDDDDIHITLAEKNSLLGGGDNTDHYHDADRDLANSFGTLAISRITGLEAAVNSLQAIIDLKNESHEENHSLQSHTDVNITGAQLTSLKNAHGTTVYDAHNVQFATASAENGTMNRVARQDHKHSIYALVTDLSSLSSAGASQTIHWANLTGVPETVGNARNFSNSAELNSATPVELGEQVIVLDYNGSGDWGVYIAIGTGVGEWSIISSQDAGLNYAAATHNHDSEYVKIADFSSDVETVINNFYSQPANQDSQVSSQDRTNWDGAVTDLATHIADTVDHIQAGERASWDSAVAHISDGTAHMTLAEHALVSDWDASVRAVEITSGVTTLSIASWIDTLTGGSSFSLTALTDWPTATGATPANLEKLMDGSDIASTLHTHSNYANASHSHVTSEITNLDAGISTFGYFKEPDVIALFTDPVPTITTTDIVEGTNKYLSESNISALASYQNILSHLADNETDRKHLSDSEVSALTTGINSNTYLHNHEGLHYPQDPTIQIGRHMRSSADQTEVGSAGLVNAPRIAASAAAPSAGTDAGETGEFRVDNDFAYFKCPDGTWRKTPLQAI